MKNKSNYEFLLEDFTKLKGVGKKTAEILKKKKINNLFDLLWRLPKSYTDRTESNNVNDAISKINLATISQTKNIKALNYSENWAKVLNKI